MTFAEFFAPGRRAAAQWNAWLSSASHFYAFLFVICIGLHAFVSAAMGAKYWFDAIVYFQLADSIFDPAALRTLYAGEYGLLFQHIMPGLPIVIAVFENLFGRWLWPAIAIFQNLINALACVYFIEGFSGRIGKFGRAVFVILVSLFPYYAAFHNAILTESLSASILLFMLGVAFRCLDGRLKALPAILVILGLMFIGAQFRSYLAGMGAGIALLLIFDRMRRHRVLLSAVAFFVSAASILAFPLYRSADGIRFFTPNNDPWMLPYVSYVVWDYSPRSQQALDGVVYDPAIRHKLIATTDDMTQDEVVKVVDDLTAHGASRGEAGRRIARAARIIRTQSFEIIERQMELSLASLGFERISTCCHGGRVVMRGPTSNADQLKHLQYYQNWNAQLDASSYQDQFSNFAQRYRHTPELYSAHAIDEYVGEVAPYVPSTQNPWRDVLRLGMLSPDLLIVTGVAGLAMLARRDWRFWTILAFAVLPVYGASLWSVVVGDNRHAHLLWPIYLLGISVALAWVARRPWHLMGEFLAAP